MTEVTPGTSETLNPGPNNAAPAELTREQALTRYAEIRADPEWLKAFAAGDQTKRDEQARLVQTINKIDLENLSSTEGARAALEREQVIDHYRRAGIDEPDIAAQIRQNLPVSAQERQWAEDRLHSLKIDRAWVSRWLAGDRAAVREKGLIDIIMGRPVLPS